MAADDEATKELEERDDKSSNPTRTLALVKKGKDCVAIAETVLSDLTQGRVDDVKQKLIGLKEVAKELAKHAENRVKEVEKAEKQNEQNIEEIERKIEELGHQLEELQQHKNELDSILSNKQSLQRQLSSELSSAESWFRDAEYEVERAKREKAKHVGGGTVIGAMIGTLFLPGIGTALGAAAGGGAGLAVNDSAVREARSRVDDCRRRYNNAQAEVSSASSAVSNVQSQINSLTSQCKDLKRKCVQYNEEAKKIKKVVLFFRKASQIWKEFQQISEHGTDRTSLLQLIIRKANEKFQEDLSWLDSSASKKVVKTFLDAWEMIETKCEQGVNFMFQSKQQNT